MLVPDPCLKYICDCQILDDNALNELQWLITYTDTKKINAEWQIYLRKLYSPTEVHHIDEQYCAEIKQTLRILNEYICTFQQCSVVSLISFEREKGTLLSKCNVIVFNDQTPTAQTWKLGNELIRETEIYLHLAYRAIKT